MSETQDMERREHEALEAFNTIEGLEPEIANALNQPKARSADVSPESLDDVLNTVRTVCQEYQKVKGFIESVLWLIERIPFAGRQITSAIRTLMSLLDTVCRLV